MKWFPICGHWFWDDNNGATAFCRKLGYPSGTVTRTFHSYDEESIKVGGCKPGEDLTSCSNGGNKYIALMGLATSTCRPGHKEGISVTCSGQMDRYSSCVEKSNIFYIHQKIVFYFQYKVDLHSSTHTFQ